MKQSMLGVIALAATLPICGPTLVHADDVRPVTLSDSDLEAVTAGAGVSFTTTGSATANGVMAATITVGNTTANSDGTTAAAGGFGSGLAGTVGGSADSGASYTFTADGNTTMVFEQSHTTNVPSWSASYTIAGVLTTDLPR